MADFSPSQEIIRQFTAFIPARAIYVAAKLGVPDHVGAEGATASELATTLNVAPEALNRLLRMLASVGVLHEEEDNRFTLTATGRALRSDTPESVRDYAVYFHDFIYEVFGQFDETVRTGEPAFDKILGMPFFQYLQENPDRAAVFHSGIGNRGRIEANSIVEAYDFSTSQQVVDVGGGNGGFLSAILVAHDNVSGVLIDRTAAIEAAKSGRGGSLPRCEFVDGDIFEQVFAGGDTYTMKRLLFDFSDEDAVRILNNCRAAIGDNGRLLVIEMLQEPSNQPDLSHAMDLMFLVMLGGRTRTGEQYAALLERAKFRLVKTIPTGSDVTVLEAIPV